MSAWLQTKGGFFWVFTWDGEDLELYKVMGETAPMSTRGGEASGFVSTMQMYSCCHCHCKKNHCLFFSSMHSCLNGLQTKLKFFAYDVKPVPVRSMRFGSWHAKSGLLAKDTLVFLFLSCICSLQHGCTFWQEGDQYYAQFILFNRPPDNPNHASPKLHMWRCKTWPVCIQQMLETQAGNVSCSF